MRYLATILTYQQRVQMITLYTWFSGLNYCNFPTIGHSTNCATCTLSRNAVQFLQKPHSELTTKAPWNPLWLNNSQGLKVVLSKDRGAIDWVASCVHKHWGLKLKRVCLAEYVKSQDSISAWNFSVLCTTDWQQFDTWGKIYLMSYMPFCNLHLQFCFFEQLIHLEKISFDLTDFLSDLA